VQFLLEKAVDPASINVTDLSKPEWLADEDFQAAIRIVKRRLERPGETEESESKESVSEESEVSSPGMMRPSARNTTLLI
jgi:hypothetical protein